MNKKVSIIVPSYNAEKYLPRAIDSILKQTYKNLEIIIVDDASSDNSKEIIKKYASSDDRIIPYYSEINQGVSKSRNMGLRTFTGDYVVFLDADDYMVEDAIEIMIDAAEKYNADVVDNYHLMIYTNKNKNYYFTENKIPKDIEVMGSLDKNIEVLTKATYITGKLIDRKLVEGLLFDESLRRYEDLVFEHQMKTRVKNMIFINKPIYYYYQVSDSLINTLGKKHAFYLDAAKKVIKNYENYNEEIKLRIEALLVQNGFLTGISKVIKNDCSIDENTEILQNYLSEFDNTFKTYKTNKYISKFIKKSIEKYKTNRKKAYNLVKFTKNIDFIKIYFKYLSIFNKYKI